MVDSLLSPERILSVIISGFIFISGASGCKYKSNEIRQEVVNVNNTDIDISDNGVIDGVESF